MSSPSPTASPTPALRVLQVVVGGMTAGIVLIGVAFALILPLATPSLAAVVGLVVLGVVLHLVVERVGYRADPLPPG